MTKRTVNGIQTAEEKMAWKKAFEDVLPGGRLSILDVGCGTGELSMLLAEMSHIMTGINLSKSMVEKAREKNKALGLMRISKQAMPKISTSVMQHSTEPHPQALKSITATNTKNLITSAKIKLLTPEHGKVSNASHPVHGGG